jgi:hypothetical protein
VLGFSARRLAEKKPQLFEHLPDKHSRHASAHRAARRPIALPGSPVCVPYRNWAAPGSRPRRIGGRWHPYPRALGPGPGTSPASTRWRARD